MPAQVISDSTPSRDPETGRFVRGEGDFGGPAQFANAPVKYDGELGPQDAAPERTAAPQQRQASPQSEVLDDDTRIALQELPEGEVISERSPAYQNLTNPQQQEAGAETGSPTPALPAPVPLPADPTQLLLAQVLDRLSRAEEQRLAPPPAPPAPKVPSLLERFKTDEAFQRSYMYDISAGRLNPDIPEHVAMAYSAAATADMIQAQEERNQQQFRELAQFKEQLTQAAVLQNSRSAAAQALSETLKDFTIVDDSEAVSRLIEQAAPWIAQGYDAKQVVQQAIAPIAKHLTRKSGQPAQQQRLRQPTPQQQAAMRMTAAPGKAAGKPGDRGPKMDVKAAMALLGKHEKHIDFEQE